jgi:alcohol dehydrogenase class IV
MQAAEAMGADISGAAMIEAGDVLADRVIEMMRLTNMPNGLSGVGYDENDLDALTEKAWPQKRLLDNSARVPDRDQLKELFRASLSYW